MGVKALEEILNERKTSSLIFGVLIILSSYVAYNQINYHPNDGFNKTEDYNNLLRMTNDEADMILAVKEWYVSNNKEHVKTISSILPLRTEMPKLMTLYGRNKAFNGNYGEYDLYEVFYPFDYFGDIYGPKNPKYDEMCPLLSKGRYELIVQDKRVNYHDKERDVYYSIMYLIGNCDYQWIHENDTYVAYVHEY